MMEKRALKKPADYTRMLFTNPLALLWLFGLLAVVIASLIPQAGLSETETGFGRDKLVRVIAFLLLSFYPAAFFSSIRLGLIISTFMAPLGFLLEVFQKYVPGRNFSPEDMIANNIGAIVGIFLALVIRFFFRTGRLRFPGKGGRAPRVALAPEEGVSYSPDNETKEDASHQVSRKRGKRGSKTPKKWRFKATVLALVLILGYVGWTMIADHTPPKNRTQNSQPESMTPPEQPVIETKAEPEMVKPDIAEPEPLGEETADEDMTFPNPVPPDAAIATVAVSDPKPEPPAPEPGSTDKTESDVTPAPAKTPLPEISAPTPTTTPEPELTLPSLSILRTHHPFPLTSPLKNRHPDVCLKNNPPRHWKTCPNHWQCRKSRKQHRCRRLILPKKQQETNRHFPFARVLFWKSRMLKT
jgi:VanZ family protein